MPPLRLLAGLALLLGPGLAAPARAQGEAAGPRVLHDLVDEVKLPDGATAWWRFTTTYDPATGETVRTVTDAAGAVVERTVTTASVVSPTLEELAEAEALVRADPEVAALLARARLPVVGGGFPLVREAGHPCGPGARCLQFDVIDRGAGGEPGTRLRYVVVDLRTGRVVDADLDAATEGNLR